MTTGREMSTAQFESRERVEARAARREARLWDLYVLFLGKIARVERDAIVNTQAALDAANTALSVFEEVEA